MLECWPCESTLLGLRYHLQLTNIASYPGFPQTHKTTVNRDIFVVNKIWLLPQTTKMLHTKFISQPIIALCQWHHIFTQPLCACFTSLWWLLCDTWTVFLTAREVRFVFISIYPVTHNSGSKPRGSRSHQRQQQELRIFASRCFPDILVNVAPMNAASLFVLRTYMYSMVDSFVAFTYVPASLSLGTRAIVEFIHLNIFRWYSQTTNILLHKKRTPESFTTRKIPDLRYHVNRVT